MILFVDVCSSCTAEDSVELVEVLDFTVVVISIPVEFEEYAPVGIVAFCNNALGGHEALMAVGHKEFYPAFENAVANLFEKSRGDNFV